MKSQERPEVLGRNRSGDRRKTATDTNMMQYVHKELTNMKKPM